MEILEIIAFVVLFLGMVIIGNAISDMHKDINSKLEDLQNDVQDLKDEWKDKFNDDESGPGNM